MKDIDIRSSLAEALRTADEHDLPPEVTQQWEPVECLGHSEHSETLLLRSKSDGSKAVLKLLRNTAKEEGLARSFSDFNHPSLPKTIHVYESDDRCCILREYVEGIPLSESATPLDQDTAVRIAVSLCDALTCLHSLQPPLIHRDLKPENVILRPDGTPVLIDFSIARQYSRDAENDTCVMGTKPFAPPEQYGFRQTDCRSDIYALGVLTEWMLTGTVRADDHAADIKDARLKRIVAKCTAFSPDDRYRSADAVKKALTDRRRQKRPVLWIALLGLLSLCGLAAIFLMTAPKAITFTEPLIEKAVRVMLGVSDTERLTEADLKKVTGLYIFGSCICTGEDAFYAAAGEWYSSPAREKGALVSLEDVRLLPSLKTLMIAANGITDISPLTVLTDLEKIEFKHNAIRDISPLTGLGKLYSVGLNDNPLSDISPLMKLPGLRFLDLCDVSSYDPAVIGELGDLEFLDISNRTDSWRYLGARRVRELKLGWTSLSSLEALSGITGLERLGIEHTAVTGLEGIEQHTGLSYLRMSGCPVDDLTPLLSLENLETLVLDASQRAAAEALGAVRFTIQYE